MAGVNKSLISIRGLSDLWQQQSLQVRIAFLAVLIGLVPVGIVGAYSYIGSQRTMDDTLRTHVNHRTEQLKNDLDTYFDQSQVTLLSIASSPAWLKFYTEPEQREEWRREQERIINHMDKVTNIGIEEFCFVGRDGKENSRLVEGHLDHDLSEDESDNPFFEPSFALGPNEVYQSEPYISPDTGRWVTAVTTLLYDEDRKLAFLHLERSVEQIQGILEQAALDESETIFILDGENKVVLSTGHAVDNKAEELVVKEVDAALLAAADHPMEAGGSREEHGGSIAVAETKGSTVYVSSRSLASSNTSANDWRVVIATPQSAIVAQNAFTLLPVLVLGLLGLSLGGATAAFKRLLRSEKQSKEALESTVSEYKRFIETVASGDLSPRLPVNSTNDELSLLGRHLNEMVESLGLMVTEMGQAAQDMTTASNEIFSATSQHNATASEQAASVKQTAATVEEVRLSAEQATERAQSVAGSAQKSVDISDSGLAAVEQTIEGMTQIKNKVEEIATNIGALSEQTQQIGNIISTVSDIAEQSNLLALNASIEAARAGEQGKGFAVVAAEVRNLAEQSQQATAQVRAILDDIQKATNTVVSVTEEGTKGVVTGMGLANQAGETIRRLAEAINASAQAAEQIVASATQQAAGMDQIAGAMNSISEATNQTLASTKQTEKAAEDLSKLGERFKERLIGYRQR
jgi:methyl-accepting chemotaxis protein